MYSRERKKQGGLWSLIYRKKCPHRELQHTLIGRSSSYGCSTGVVGTFRPRTGIIAPRTLSRLLYSPASKWPWRSLRLCSTMHTACGSLESRTTIGSNFVQAKVKCPIFRLPCIPSSSVILFRLSIDPSKHRAAYHSCDCKRLEFQSFFFCVQNLGGHYHPIIRPYYSSYFPRTRGFGSQLPCHEFSEAI